MFPFVPDTGEIQVYTSYVYQTLDINSCRREELENLPFLTPDQVKNVLSNRPYRDWEDFLRRSGLPPVVAMNMRRFVVFGKGRHHYALFLRAGSGGVRLSVKGKRGDYSAYVYAGGRTSFALFYGGFTRVAFGNLFLSSPLGFAGYSGFYTGGWGPRYVLYAPPSLFFGVGKWGVKVDTFGVIGGVFGYSGGVFLIREWGGTHHGVGYLRYGPAVFETALSRGFKGFGVAVYKNGVGFRWKYSQGDGFWPEGNPRESHSVWFSVPLRGSSLRAYISGDRRRLTWTYPWKGGRLRVEHEEVWRVSLKVGWLEGGVCQ